MPQQSWLTKKNIQEFLFMTFGITLVSVGVYFFKFPNHFSIGGVSGLAIVLAQLIPVPWLTASVYNGVINLLFLLLGFLLLDKGFDITAGLCSLLGLVLKSVLVDSVIESLNRHKAFMIITYHPEVVTKYITESLGRGATVWSGQGAYTHEEHLVVLTVLARHQAVLLRRYLKQNDPHAFMIVTNSSEIFGKGFLRA